MNDEKLQAVLKRASEDVVFRYSLMNDRDATLANLDLSEAEKNMLKTVSSAQLEKMIDKYGWWKRQMKFSHSSGDFTTILTGVAILAILSGMTLGMFLRKQEPRTVSCQSDRSRNYIRVNTEAMPTCRHCRPTRIPQR
ncbi:MAG: hypothetical protein A2X48_16330 [Lentisphaerae bacterium GWF2_49_21]|nr:MAG: hypothetical protein A2X48_16330 [Lentisphaerae bacterium GWF2_49_21]